MPDRIGGISLLRLKWKAFISHVLTDTEIATLLSVLPKYERVVLGTLNAYTQPTQTALVGAVLKSGAPTVDALRMPSDLSAFPQAPAYVCTYSILLPSTQVLAGALWGQAALLIPKPGLYPAGYCLEDS